jgi:hypothetical protein
VSADLGAVAEIVERTRAEQGLPSRVEDPGTLHRVSRIFLTREATPARDRDRLSSSRSCTDTGTKPDG